MMRTYLVTVPEKDKEFVSGFFKKMKLRSRILKEEELEEAAIAEKIIEGMKSEDVPKEKLLKHFRKHGVDC